MTSGFVVQTCLVTSFSSSHAPLPDRPFYISTRASYYRRSSSQRLRQQRRAQRASSAHSAPTRKRSSTCLQSSYAPPSARPWRRAFFTFSWTRNNMSLQRAASQRGPSRAAADNSASLDAVLAGQMPPTSPSTTAVSSTAWSRVDDLDDGKAFDDHWAEEGPASPSPAGRSNKTRSIRSMSSASRNTNRLSITLPVALPDSYSSRPTPSTSIPPTPLDTPVIDRHSDPNEVISAIAAQERRILELREELSRAEGDLSKLKKTYTTVAGRRKRHSARPAEPLRSLSSPRDSLNIDTQQKSELERRKAILLAQSQAFQRDSKRRVIRGNHTRTLSLLSPSTDGPAEPSLLDSDILMSPASTTSEAQPEWQPDPVRLNKRATWAPRQTQPPTGMKQIASDFRQGLWTFVEDLRQATVGDEAITGTSNRTTEMTARLGKMDLEDQETIRASTISRPRIPFPTGEDAGSSPSSSTEAGDSGARVQHRRSLSRPEPKSRKRFSWTPPSFDNLDDDDWSNWDSPNVKTSRWSGSTVNGDIIPAIPEKTDDSEGIDGQRQPRTEVRATTPPSSTKLEELPQAIFNKLTPTGLKTLPSQFMKDWERSLSPPEDPSAFEARARDMQAISQ